MASDESSQSVSLGQLKERFLECGVCFQEYDEETHHPRLLPCLHSYCYSCLETLIKNGQLKCPVCLTVHEVPNNDISTLRKDNTRRDLLDFIRVKYSPSKLICDCCIDDNQAMFRCKNCSEFLCNDCYKYHLRNKKSSQHEVIPLTNFKCSTDDMKYFIHHNICQIHDEDLKFYCESDSCQKPICTACVITQHKESGGHVIRDINDVYYEMQSNLEDVTKNLEQKIESINNVVRNIETAENDVKSDSLSMKEEIEKDFDKNINALKQRKQILMEEVQSIEKEKLKLLDAQKSNLVSIKDDIVQSCDVLQQSRLSRNASAFLQIAPVITNRLTQLQMMDLDTDLVVESGAKYIPTRLEGEFERTVNTLGAIISGPVQGISLRVECEDKVHINTDLIVSVVIEKFNKRYFQEHPLEIYVELTIPGIEGSRSKASGEESRFMTLVRSSQIGNNTINVYVNGILVKYEPKYVQVYAEGSEIYKKLELEMETRKDLYKVPDLQLDDLSTFSGRFISDDRRILSNTKAFGQTAFPNVYGIGSTSAFGSGKVYFDCQVEYVLKNGKIDDIFEIGFAPEPSVNIDTGKFTSAWTTVAYNCRICKGIGLHPQYNCKSLHHYPVSHVGEGVQFSRLFGFLLDADNRNIFVLDKGNRQVVYQFDFVDCSLPIWPVFRICKADIAKTTINLISKKDIKPLVA